MLRCKWLYYELPISLIDLSRHMANLNYSQNNDSGFLLSKSSQNKLTGKYIQKIMSISTVESPLGEISNVEVVDYYIVNFCFLTGSNFVYIIDPPRSLKRFINEIYNIVGLGFILTDIQLDPLCWAEEVKSYTRTFSVYQISASGLKVSKDTSAKFTFDSILDARDDFKNFIKTEKIRVDNIRFLINISEQLVKIELSKNGICKIVSPINTSILDILNVCLMRVNKNKKLQ